MGLRSDAVCGGESVVGADDRAAAVVTSGVHAQTALPRPAPVRRRVAIHNVPMRG